jgi:hypothetical protein
MNLARRLGGLTAVEQQLHELGDEGQADARALVSDDGQVVGRDARPVLGGEWRLLLAGGRVIFLFPSGGDGPNPGRVGKGRGFRIAEAMEIA